MADTQLANRHGTGLTATNDLDFELDIFGQQPAINIYTQLCLCYSVQDPSSHSTIISTLTKGLERLSASFPWVAGKVVNEGQCEGNTGVFEIKALEKTPRLVVKDLRDEPSIPTFDVLQEAKFPFRMLDESIVAPRRTLPTPEELASDTPVLVIQANFITGGLLLTFVGHHGVMDMTGQGHVMHLLSKACRGEGFTSEELSVGNIDRCSVIPFFDDLWTPGPELDRQIVKPTVPPPVSDGPDGQPVPPPPPKSSWSYFIFSPSSLASLKSLGTKSVSSGFVSTDDTLSAFIWQAVTRGRIPRLDAKAESTFARAIDPRRYLDIPTKYPGLVQNMTYHTYTAERLAEEPLGSVASNLRSAVDPKTSDIGYRTRALATYLKRSPHKNVANVTATLDLSSGIMLSSWAKENSYDLDFGLGLGKPEAVRRPQFVPVESLMYLMPKRQDGEIVAGLCLRDEDMERLKVDEEFVKYGKYIG